MRLQKSLIKDGLLRLLGPVLSQLYTGLGSIFMFHRVVAAERLSRIGYAYTETTPEFLRAVVEYLRDGGFDIIGIDDVPERVLRPQHQRRFAVLTFDDGYEDTGSVVAPLFRELGVPFTVYCVADYLDRKTLPWWYPIESFILEHDEVVIRWGETRHIWPARNLDEKRHAFDAVTELIESLDPNEARRLACDWLGEQEVARAAERLLMGWDEVIALARSSDVTIGSHSVTHPPIALLPEVDAVREFVESRQRLEARLGRPVHHFAYPYGGPRQARGREFAYARAAGYRTATTTRLANVFGGHRYHLQALPRVYAMRPDLEELHSVVSGSASALRHRGARLVTV